jgi:predicted Zn-ribbon and HTH transcriptional regulator
MAMKKADMEAHQAEYHALMASARTALQQGLHRKAIELALSTWDHIDGMMQYERKYEERDFASVESIDLILRLAPLLFDFESLRSLDSLLKSQRRIERDTTDDLATRLARATQLMRDAQRLWNHIERQPYARQDELAQKLGGDQRQWRAITETWEQLGVVVRAPDRGSYLLALATRTSERVPAKCASCGVMSHEPKTTLLQTATCPSCQSTASFVLISAESV